MIRRKDWIKYKNTQKLLSVFFFNKSKKISLLFLSISVPIQQGCVGVKFEATDWLTTYILEHISSKNMKEYFD